MQQPIIGPGGRPMLSQETAQQMQLQQMYWGVYFSLVPVVAGDELRTHDHWQNQELDLDRITKTAKRIALAAMKEIGVIIE